MQYKSMDKALTYRRHLVAKPTAHLFRLLLASAVPAFGGTALAQDHAAPQSSFVRYAPPAPEHPAGQSATLLPDGRWLLIGGGSANQLSNTLQIEDPSTADHSPQGLPATLSHPRTNHTATVLPDGTVFIFGGTGPDGALVSEAELFDPQTQTLQTVPGTGLTPRARHTATLLTDGLVLIAGGLDRSGTPDQVSELYNPKTRKAEPLTAALLTARSDHQAALLANGKGLVWGGKDSGGQLLANGELYDPAATRFSGVDSAADPALPAKELAQTAPQIADSVPQAKSTDVPVDSRVAVRFTEPLKAQTVTAASVTLIGPGGAVGGKVVAAEGGMLAFFTPSADLSPATTYTLFLNGLTDTASRPLPFSSFSFTTHRFQANEPGGVGQSGANLGNASAQSDAAKAASRKSGLTLVTTNRPQPTQEQKDKKPQEEDDNNEDWVPTEPNQHGAWRVLGLANDPKLYAGARFASALAVAPAGSTALSGQIARLNGKPLVGVPVSMGAHAAVTDASGSFILAGLPPGIQTLKVDGTAVLSGGRHYTKHFIQVNLAKGKTTAMPATIFLPRVDPASEISIASPMDKDLVLTHPAIPGLEVHIPKGAVLREYDGKVVTKLSITPIPVDRAPYPAPIDFSVYFTLQPGGAFVDGDPSKVVKIIYPNYQNFAPGTTVDFWNYDPNGGGWKVYGQGLVSRDGKKIVPNKNLGFRQIMTFGFGVGGRSVAPASTAPVDCGKNKADPVDCFTGLFTHTVTDIALPDVMPISVTRTYRQNDPASRAFGIGTDLSYDMYLYTTVTGDSPSPIDLVLSDSSRIHFYWQSGTISGRSGVWTNTDSPTAFHGAVLTTDPTQELFHLKLSDGTTLTFGTHPYNQLQSITDRNGNTVTITLGNGNTITQVTSPNGRYIQFGYDSSNRITTATDNLGRTVTYTYNAPNCAGCLWTVRDMDLNTEQYGYTDPNDYTRLTTVTDKRSNLVTTNTYDPTSGRVTKQTLADGSFWLFSYGQDGSGNPQTTITDPRGYVEVETFNSSGYITQDLLAQNQPEQRTYLYNRDSTNLVQTATDPFGRVTKYTYDPYGDVTSVTRLYGTPNAVTDSFGYDPNFHQLNSYQDALNNTWTFNPDGNGNLLSVVDPLNHTTGFINNGQGLPTQITDALQHSIQIGYQQADLSSITDALGRRVSIFTDGAGRPMSMTDPLGFRTLYSYDNMDRLQNVTDPQNGVTAMTYDPNGNLATVIDPRNIGTHRYHYDTSNRLQSYQDPLGVSETYDQYDGLDNLLHYTDRKGQVTRYQYDPLNRLKLITYNDGSTVNITYYPNRDVPQQAVDSANGTVSWQFDNLDRLTQETTPQGQVNYSYYANGLRQTMTAPGQAQLTYCYDNANRPVNIITGTSCSSPTGILTVFGYDNADRRTGLTLPNGVTATYGYDDPDNDLQTIAYANGGNSLGSITYGYDNAGRRNSRNSSIDHNGLPSPVNQARYDAANRLTRWGSQALSYDANGNLTGDGTNSYNWNARNQLASISGGATASFAYDARGRRRSRTVSGAATSFLYDGANLVQEQRSSGNASYLAGGLDETFSRTDSSGTQSYLTDALGSTVGLSSSAGSTVTGYTYDAYGNTSTTGAASANALQYAGRENDGTGLYFNRARYYSPKVGRFISQDPIGLAGGINTYAYVDGDPILYIDPEGNLASLPEGLVDFSAAFGDTISWGATNGIRNWMGTNSVVNKCSGAYAGGTATGVVWGLAWGGATAGRYAANVGARTFLSDSRAYSTVQRIWSNSVGGYKGSYELHHWFTPQSLGGTSAGWNLAAVSPWLNNAMGDGGILYSAFRASMVAGYLGAVGTVPTAIASSHSSSCTCGN
jgi:RHS repeat-associated protein